MKYRKRLYLSIISLITFFAMNANVNRPLEDFFQYGPLDHTNREAEIIWGYCFLGGWIFFF